MRTVIPVNRFPAYVGEAVRALRAAFPMLGTKRIAQWLARMGLHLAEATVRRMLKHESEGDPQAGPPNHPANDAAASANTTTKASAERPAAARVTAKYHTTSGTST